MLVVVLAATAIIGGSLAYFTDTDEATNTFAMGNVKIELIETDREGNILDPDKDLGPLVPIIGSAQGERDPKYPLWPNADNYIDKKVDIKNTGNLPAYVRVIMAIPASMDHETDASKNLLHWNSMGAEKPGDDDPAYWTRINRGTITIDDDYGGIEYRIYELTYQFELPVPGDDEAGSTVWPAICGVYLDKFVDINIEEIDGVTNYTYSKKVDDEVVKAVFKGTQKPKILLYAQAVQSQGWASEVDEGVNIPQYALDEAFGKISPTNNPWVD